MTKGHSVLFPGFNVPVAIINHPQLEDVSWGNDAMPSWEVKGHPEFVLYVDADSPLLSEFNCEGSRFNILRESDVYFETNNLAEVLAKIETILCAS